MTDTNCDCSSYSIGLNFNSKDDSRIAKRRSVKQVWNGFELQWNISIIVFAKLPKNIFLHKHFAKKCCLLVLKSYILCVCAFFFTYFGAFVVGNEISWEYNLGLLNVGIKLYFNFQFPKHFVICGSEYSYFLLWTYHRTASFYSLISSFFRLVL